MIIFLQTLTVYPIYLRERCGLTEATIGLLFTINTILIVAFEMVLIASVDRLRRLPLIGLGCVLICVGFGILPLSNGLAFIALSVVIWTVGEMLSMPLLTTWIGERAPASRRSEYMGASTAMFSLSWVVAPLFGGAMFALHPDAVWLSSLVLAGVVGAAFVLLARKLESSRVPAAEGSQSPADSKSASIDVSGPRTEDIDELQPATD